MKNKIKVVISGLIFPFTILGYFWRAFERRDDIDLFVTGPFSDDYIPWNYGMTLSRKYVKQPHYPLPLGAAKSSLPASFVESRLPWKPDLWLQIDAGWHFTTRPNANMVGHIQTDPHVLKQLYQQPKSYSDVVWCMQTPYIEPGEVYLPYGWDVEFHRPLDTPKIHDACLVGLHYPQRDALVDRLRSRGLDVYYSIGEIYDQYQLRYNQSKIALSWSSKQDLPARVWESMAMGIPTVTNRVPDLTVNNLQEGKHFLGFDTLDEAEKQVMKLLVDEQLFSTIAENGRLAVESCSWDNRVEQILGDCGLL